MSGVAGDPPADTRPRRRYSQSAATAQAARPPVGPAEDAVRDTERIQRVDHLRRQCGCFVDRNALRSLNVVAANAPPVQHECRGLPSTDTLTFTRTSD